MSKWDSIVARNRTAEQLSFPLKRVSAVKVSHTSKIPEFLRGFNTKSDLMKKFEELDPTLLHPAVEEEQKDNKYKMPLEQIILRRKEAARLRAQQVQKNYGTIIKRLYYMSKENIRNRLKRITFNIFALSVV